ncbi:AraC family transcriptional regulator [Xanthobacter dioxanivorans]|uniref:AraC family transcriptional regulator n=1 Tax=Xanthobacter dioxanivorans TaxID=2528964 RepID=A0A974SJ82_9HYPH|nr:AraC family transcriptional regulator [Xanthobacter dioxanivorans]QRG06969.1 AraC family transcriptional regulator [Xanthobacter dioxanivorans]
MDPFSDVIALLRPCAALSKPITGRGDWGVRYAAYGQPGFAIVLAGRCWLAIGQEDPVLLDQGDFVLLPATPAFALFSRPGVACVLREPSEVAVHHGEPEGEPDFRMLGGSFRIDPVNAPVLLALLPAMIHVRSSDADTGRLGRIVDLIMDECGADRPGRDMILERLLEVMLVECLRWHGLTDDTRPAGLLAGMRDPALAKVLRAMHADVRVGWTVADLATLAGMSRSAFAARFGETLGCAPIEYLARWRMALAQDALSRGGQSLERLAEEIGYESASAFSTAFRRRVGMSPGLFARSRQPARCN